MATNLDHSAYDSDEDVPLTLLLSKKLTNDFKQQQKMKRKAEADQQLNKRVKQESTFPVRLTFHLNNGYDQGSIRSSYYRVKLEMVYQTLADFTNDRSNRYPSAIEIFTQKQRSGEIKFRENVQIGSVSVDVEQANSYFEQIEGFPVELSCIFITNSLTAGSRYDRPPFQINRTFVYRSVAAFRQDQEKEKWYDARKMFERINLSDRIIPSSMIIDEIKVKSFHQPNKYNQDQATD
jgi:hypothetical protein